jgi:hypothetical protein
MNHPAVFFTSALVTQLPMLLIAVIGVVLARSKLRQSYAKARRLATVGFGLMALHVLVASALRTYVDVVTTRSGDRLALVNFFTYVNMVAYLLLVASLVLLLLAVFADRDSQHPV